MRDYYDIHALMLIYKTEIKPAVFKKAFTATCKKRNTEKLPAQAENIIAVIKGNDFLQTRWDSYRKKYFYASDITFQDVTSSLDSLIGLLK